jgi:hypothetical protein
MSKNANTLKALTLLALLLKCSSVRCSHSVMIVLIHTL